MTTSKLIGKRVEIKSADSQYKGDWGVIKLIENNQYHIALWNGDDTIVLDRDEITIKR